MSKILVDRKYLEWALQALEKSPCTALYEQDCDVCNAIEAIRGELQRPDQEPVAWRTFDGEGGYDYRTYDDNENYRDEWDKRNPAYKGWVEPLYTHEE